MLMDESEAAKHLTRCSLGNNIKMDPRGIGRGSHLSLLRMPVLVGSRNSV